MEKIPVAVIGVGMVGTPLARYFQELKGYERGRELFLCDADPAKGYADDVNPAAIVFIAVPTPRSPSGASDLSAVESAFARLTGEKIVVLRSTVPPGTTESFQRRYPAHRILFNPEFLTARMAWEDFVRPDRQIVGFTAVSLDAAHLVRSLLPKAPFMSPWGVNTNDHIRITATEAEIIKYASNLHYYRKVNWANLLARVAERMAERLGSEGALVAYDNIRRAMAADFRIGDSHLDVTHGGYRGAGGRCLPKDMDAFVAHCRALGLGESAALLEADRAFNVAILREQGLTLEEVARGEV